MALKFYTSVVKGLNLKVRKFWGLTPTFIELPEEKLIGRGAFPLPTPPPPIPNRFNENSPIVRKEIMNTLKNKINELHHCLTELSFKLLKPISPEFLKVNMDIEIMP